MEKSYDKSLWPKEKKKKPNSIKTDDMGFAYSETGSFWDIDDEYFNKEGYDVHGGYYTKEKEYIYGPDWLSDLACYEDEKEKYINSNPLLEDLDDEEDILPNIKGLTVEEMRELEGDDLGDFGGDGPDDFDFEKALKEAEKYKTTLSSGKPSHGNKKKSKKK